VGAEKAGIYGMRNGTFGKQPFEADMRQEAKKNPEMTEKKSRRFSKKSGGNHEGYQGSPLDEGRAHKSEGRSLGTSSLRPLRGAHPME